MQWYVDPVGCILISVVLVYRWIAIMKDQMEKVTGASAPADYIETIRNLVRKHSDHIQEIDRVVAYYSGSKYNIEVDLLLPGDVHMRIAQDIAFSLQNILEELPDVERAYVTVRIIVCVCMYVYTRIMSYLENFS